MFYASLMFVVWEHFWVWSSRCFFQGFFWCLLGILVDVAINHLCFLILGALACCNWLKWPLTVKWLKILFIHSNPVGSQMIGISYVRWPTWELFLQHKVIKYLGCYYKRLSPLPSSALMSAYKNRNRTYTCIDLQSSYGCMAFWIMSRVIVNL